MRKTLITIFFCVTALLWTPFRSSAFGVSPATIDLSGNRGEVLESSFSVVNESAVEQIYYLSVIKFESRQGSNAPRFIPFNEDHSGFPEWISFEQPSFAVPARSKVDVPLKIALPADVIASGYYAAVLVSNTPSEVVATNGATTNAQTAVLLFLSINGKTDETLALLTYETPDVNSVIKELVGLNYEFSVQNQGNVHVVPKGNVIVRDIFGRVLAKKEINEKNSRVLPLTTRTFKGVLETVENQGFLATATRQLQNLAVGPVTVSLELTYGASEKMITETKNLWIIPTELLLLGLLIATSLLVGWKVAFYKRR